MAQKRYREKLKSLYINKDYKYYMWLIQDSNLGNLSLNLCCVMESIKYNGIISKVPGL